MPLRIRACADAALLVELGGGPGRDTSARVLALREALRAAALPGVLETVPGYTTLTVHYDPLRTSAAALQGALAGLEIGAAAARPRDRHWRLPVCYEGEHAPDLEAVAQACGLDSAAVVAAHSAPAYYCYLLGFAPGFGYLGDLPPALRLPRRDHPRLRTPAGAVAIADRMTAVYPVESPGGWHLIGNTPVRLFDTGHEPPALLRPGDHVSFEPVSAAEHARIRAAVAAGEYTVPGEPDA